MTAVRDLVAVQDRIWRLAAEEGLDPLPTHFEQVPPAIMYEFGAYGIPGRFSHWTRGKAYHRLKTQYDYGLNKIYELVINSEPCQAFLLETNTPVENVFVMAHVAGHADFFHHNVYFQATNRRMPDEAAAHARRIRRYEFDQGTGALEEVLDAALAVQRHVDPWSVDDHFRDRHRRTRPSGDGAVTPRQPGGSAAPAEEGGAGEGPVEAPTRDLLAFVHAHAPYLEEWERDIVDIVRRESLYFYPQLQTKIANEGYASFWHQRLMRRLDLSDEDYTEFARLHARIQETAPSRVSPYSLGLAIYEDIAASEGVGGVLAVRELENDVAFLRNHLTPDIVEELGLFTYAFDDDEDAWLVGDTGFEAVRDTLVQRRVNNGVPLITVEDGDYRDRGELYLRHAYDGRPLELPDAEETLKHVHRLWQRPVHLATEVDGETRVLVESGQDHEEGP